MCLPLPRKMTSYQTWSLQARVRGPSLLALKMGTVMCEQDTQWELQVPLATESQREDGQLGPIAIRTRHLPTAMGAWERSRNECSPWTTALRLSRGASEAGPRPQPMEAERVNESWCKLLYSWLFVMQRQNRAALAV